MIFDFGIYKLLFTHKNKTVEALHERASTVCCLQFIVL